MNGYGQICSTAGTVRPLVAVCGLLYPIAMLGKLLKGYRYRISIFTPFYWQTMDDSHLLDIYCLVILPWVNPGLCVKHIKCK